LSIVAITILIIAIY